MRHHISSRGFASALLAIVLTLLVWLPPAWEAQSAESTIRLGGAPPPGSGPMTTPAFVRVLDGRTFETLLDGNQVLVVLVGIDVAPGNTACGREAAQQLQVLARGGLRLEEDATIAFDARNYRVYYALTKDGRSVTQELVKAGLAQVNATGEAAHRFPNDAANARAVGKGCLWNSDAASRMPTASKALPAKATPAGSPGKFRSGNGDGGVELPHGDGLRARRSDLHCRERRGCSDL